MISSVIIQFDRQPNEFKPLENVSGTFRTVDVNPKEIARIEFSLLWFTEGKGDEDLGVHFFKSVEWPENEQIADSGQDSPSLGNQFILASSDSDGLTYFFSVRLPASPLTWYGKILKIYWCARVRIFLKNRREVKSERVFTVGKVPPVQVELN